MRNALLIVAAGLLASTAAAQIAVGDRAPAVEADKLLNTKLRSLGDLKGRLVLYEFFAHW